MTVPSYAPMNVSLPPFMTLTDGMVIRITALDPLTGNVVSAVNVSGVVISVDQDATPPEASSPGTASGAYLAGE